MHIGIDIIAVLILLFFLLAGWHKGFLLSLLGIVRVILSYGLAYVSGRYLGVWLGGVIQRPRIVTIPVCAVLAFALVAFVFHIIMYEVRAKRKEREKQEGSQPLFLSCLAGGMLNLAAGALTLILLFWMGDLFFVGMTGHSLPGSYRSHAVRYSRQAVYEAAYAFTSRKGTAQQANAMAHVISNPAVGMEHLENILASDSVQQLVSDKQFAEDLLSGDAERIRQNASVQQLFNDMATRDELQELGILSGFETEQDICNKLAAGGRNERIQKSIQSLRLKGLLRTDKITVLIRDPEFDIIVAEILK
jgi:hypothetical protein